MALVRSVSMYRIGGRSLARSSLSVDYFDGCRGELKRMSTTASGTLSADAKAEGGTTRMNLFTAINEGMRMAMKTDDTAVSCA